ncbi:MAG: hypothetical protein V4440_14635 [Pseudomonadota bacterium]
MSKARIDLTDSGIDILMKMSDGNPGALTVIADLMKKESSIDPDSIFSQFGISTILSMDTHGIYGSDIWILFKDICKQNLVNVIGLLRAVQLGFLGEGELLSFIRNQSIEQTFLDEKIAQVKERLPNFAVKDEAVATT